MNLKRITLDDTVEETVNKINENSTDIEENMSRLEAEFIPYKDNITLKTSKIEKELNDYKATMQQINIHQNPTQKASGHGIVSLPKNAAEGQVSSVGIKGLTATNLVKNGDFSNGTTGWSAENGNITANNNIATHTINKHFRGDIKESGKHKAVIGNKLFVRAKMRVTNSQCQAIYLIIEYLKNNVWVSQNSARLLNPVENQWYNLSAVLELRDGFDYEDYRLVIRHQYEDEDTALGKQMEVKEVIMIDLTAHGLDHLTAEEVNTMLPNWFDGTKSTIGAVRIKSVGKNLFDKTKMVVGHGVRFSHGDLIAAPDCNSSDFIKVQAGQDYIISNCRSAGSDIYGIAFYDINRNYLFGDNYNGSTYITITTPNIYVKPIPAGVAYIRFSIRRTIEFDGSSTQMEKGTQKTPYEPYTESTQYITAKDDEGKIVELRSLPNGTKDEIDATRGKLIKRVSDWITLDGNERWFVGSSIGGWKTVGETVPFYSYDSSIGTTNKQRNGSVYSPDFSCYKAGEAGLITSGDREGFSIGDRDYVAIRIAKSKLTGYSDELSSDEKIALFKQWLSQNPIRLIYQLAEPIEIPIQVSGSIVSYPNGTIYIERILPDAGVYTDKITILYQGAPIKRLDKLSKVDFMTGVETELDISQAEISEDKLSFTHPELNAGDIVFFEYEYDVESTEGETEVEFYDSRYVVKDDVTGKFYKWNVKVSNGTPTIEVVEV